MKHISYDNNRKNDDMLNALDLLPAFNKYDKDNMKLLSDIYLSLGNAKSFINFIILFGGKKITIPKINDVELTLRLVMAYNEFIKTTPSLIYNQSVITKALSKYNIPKTKDNVNKFKRIDSYLNRK